MDDAACKGMQETLTSDAPVEGPDDVTLETNYGGVFEKAESGLEYKGGGSRTLCPIDADLLSYFEVKGLAEDVGFTNVEEIYYVIPWLSMEDGIRPLKTDYDSLDMAECVRKTKKISAYIVHKVDDAVVIPPTLPSCKAEKETCTSKEPKSVDRKRGERHWPQHDFPLDPPPITIGPGRLKKNRRRDPHEDPKKLGKLSKHGSQMSCGTCKQLGHNKRSCPNKDKANQPQPKRGRG
ncbi:hypothetical protein Cgig2_029801 [Carnegiea gigantea]|uniref:PB1-like domain-containing protein n=1 Tax=Carnegiea gigantea TaxID=171969 RepID=A0A9Q1QLV3_9CARY|nr:hypothetical protein Cgig2_029801 [Carnegiea gigantea]